MHNILKNCFLSAMVLKDSDYLSVIFHLYDSEDEEEERHKLAQRQKKEMRRSVSIKQHLFFLGFLGLSSTCPWFNLHVSLVH